MSGLKVVSGIVCVGGIGIGGRYQWQISKYNFEYSMATVMRDWSEGEVKWCETHDIDPTITTITVECNDYYSKEVEKLKEWNELSFLEKLKKDPPKVVPFPDRKD